MNVTNWFYISVLPIIIINELAFIKLYTSYK